MKYLVINNPTSGKTTSKQTNRLKLALSNKEHEWIEVSRSVSLESQIGALDDIYDVVIISGGDGTINMCLQVLKKLKLNKKILIYPTGTTNEFAMHRNRNVDTFVKQLNGEMGTELFDAGRVNGETWFSYSLSFGTITKLSYLTPQKYKNKLGYFAYWLYGFASKLWLRMKHYDISFIIDDETIEGEFIFGSITNSYSLGNVLKFPANSVKLDDGLLEVFLIRRPKNIKDVTIVLSDLITRNFKSSPYFIFKKAKKIYVNSDSKISWNCDGELMGRFQNIFVEVQEKAVEC